MWGRQTFGLSSKLFPKFEMFILQKGQGLEKCIEENGSTVYYDCAGSKRILLRVRWV